MMMKGKSRLTAEKKIRIWLGAAVGLALIFVAFSVFQIRKYEQSVLDIYADAQDAYVQLVLDQINIVADRAEYEIVEDILSTLDSSSNRYWTFSDEEALIFVKDVAETNRYKGFTTSTYYVSDEAKGFIAKLRTNKVVHDIIPINTKKYVASGVAFEYNGTMYQMCLLTNPRTVLDHNVYMNARINLSVMIGIVVLMFLVTAVMLVLTNHKKDERIKSEHNTNTELRRMVEKLTAALERKRLFDTQLTVFHHSVLPMFLEKLAERSIRTYSVFTLRYETAEKKEHFLVNCQVLLDQRVFRFQNTEEQRIILVAVQQNRDEVMRLLTTVLEDGIRMERVITKRNQNNG